MQTLLNVRAGVTLRDIRADGVCRADELIAEIFFFIGGQFFTMGSIL